MAAVDDEVVMSDDEGTCNLPNKKARTEVYPVGTIKKIRVFDFMTYAGLVAITPGPSLNLILGPNGTGKSSLVCAICVGLGGSTKLLGRADNLADYIRRGKKSCWIEITLSGGCGGNAVSGATGSRGRSTSGDQVIRREIKSQGGRDGHALTYDSSWMLNGRSCIAKDVKDLVLTMNIQFDNLCQFLPQDKVTEFATMTPCQLLEATEKAIGDAVLHGMHLKLIELKRKYKQDKEVWENNERTLQKFRLEHAKQHRDYERFEAREGLKKEIDLLQKKILWLRYIECKKRLNDAKEKLAAASATLRAKTAEIQEDTEPLRKLEKKLIKLREERDKVFRNALALRRAWEQASKKLDDAKIDLDQTVDKKAQLQGKSDRHKAKLAEMRREVSQLEADIENAPADAPQQLYDQKHALRADFEAELTKYNACVDEISDLRRQMLRYEQELSSVDRQLDQLQDPREQRLKKMEDKRRGVSEVYHWIRQNRHRFSGDVFGPVAMEVSCSRREYAGYVETQIWGLLYHFVVSSRADEEVLSEYLRSRGRDAAPFTVAAVSSDVSRPLDHPLGPSQVYSQAYVDHMMDEVIVAPPLVKHFLKDVAKINTVFICRRGGAIQILQEAVAAHLSRRPDALNMYMEGIRFQMTSSRYNNSTSYTQITDAKPAHLLDGELSSEMAETKARLESQKHQLRLDISNLEQTIAQLNAQAMQAQTGGESLKQQIISIDQAIMKIKSKKLEFGKLLKVKRSGLANELKKPDPIQEQGTLLEEMKQHTAEMLLQGEEAARFVLKLWQTQQELAPLELCIKEGEMQVSALNEASERQKATLKEHEMKVRQLEVVVERESQVAGVAKRSRDAEGPSTPEFEALLKQDPKTEDEVAELVRSKEMEMDAIVCANPNVIREYNDRQKAIEQLEKEVSLGTSALEVLSTQMSEVKDKWLPELTAVVDTINKSFGENFAEIGCAGEVSLSEEALRAEEYEKCAIEIRVKFRESEEMQLLTSSRQSGGERSVSTLLFLIALQGVTVTPFRVIDEINQGMDPINERKVFTLLVESSCRPDTPQCFLLTPKLLPGLHYQPAITVLQIMNGPHISTQLPTKAGNLAHVLLGNRASAVAVS